MGYATPDTEYSGGMALIPLPIELVQHLAIAKSEDVDYRTVVDAALAGAREWLNA